MYRALIAAGAVAILAGPAFAQTPAAQNPPASTAPPAMAPAKSSGSTAAQTAPSTADFVQKAAISGMFEIQSSELALRKHVRADRSFAERMIRDHRRLANDLKRTVRTAHVDTRVPTKLDDEHQKMLDQLRGESGATFAKDYAQMQQQGHQEAVTLFQGYSQGGDNPKLKQMASKALPILQDHLKMANKLS